MKHLFELYKPKAKKEKEWWDANDKKKITDVVGGKSSFEGEPVKTYDRKNYGAKPGEDTRGEKCE